ncbi:hypothetical protein JKP88DRAFT_297022 [Tribonema minus]|uniref:Coenzyme Q-binding protein COQ10 START domain-containing protein n=1 Tax=Tribonema minus TaxID=303371 RepID=A0A835ZLE1_9STRA|nr:hypothetical protein JKP88DRAFT_297022 [Tribonema minus]
MGAAAGAAQEPLEPPRPAFLPELTLEEKRTLARGERVQRQTRQGSSGTGLVVVDVRADAATAMEVLQSFAAYGDMIDTVREARILGQRGGVTKAEFLISRFKLRVRVLLKSNPAASTVEFELDPDCKAAGKSVLNDARGIWYVERPPDCRPGHCRIWLVASLVVSGLVPGFLVDYAAARALPRASTWLKPTCERVQRSHEREGRRHLLNAVAATAAAAAQQQQQQQQREG